MSKGLEAYKIVKEECGFAFGGTANGDRVRENLPIIEKELKALKIIKEKEVNVRNLIDYELNHDNSYEEYLDDYNYADNYFELGHELLTQEEYDLLKEVLL